MSHLYLYIFGVKTADKKDETFFVNSDNRAIKSAVVEFTNMLTPSFCGPRSQKRKNADYLTQFFQLLGSEKAKAAYKTLMKLAPDCR